MSRLARFTVAQAAVAESWAGLAFEFLRQPHVRPNAARDASGAGVKNDPAALKQRREEFITATERAAAILLEFRFHKIFAYSPTPRTYRTKAYAIYEATNLHWWMW